jgi:hypothetical protein
MRIRHNAKVMVLAFRDRSKRHPLIWGYTREALPRNHVQTKFSGFAEPQLLSHLQARDADGLVITGSETDVCVLGTVLTASSLYETRFVVLPTKVRFSEQIGTANADEIIDAWS